MWNFIEIFFLIFFLIKDLDLKKEINLINLVNKRKIKQTKPKKWKIKKQHLLVSMFQEAGDPKSLKRKWN